MKTKTNVLTGTVTQFNAERNFGIVMDENSRRSHCFSLENGPRKLRSSAKPPMVNGERAAALPKVGDKVNFILVGEKGQEKLIHWERAMERKSLDLVAANYEKSRRSQSEKFMDRLRKRLAMASPNSQSPTAMPSKPKPFSQIIRLGVTA